MCGLAGLLRPRNDLDHAHLLAIAASMGEAIAHRGPDDDGVWCDSQAGVALAHRRLSILDLSPLGHQPMASADGRYVIAYNGEVYNFAVLREELRALGHAFRGHSDTEVLLAAVVQWGVEAAIARCNGMFAIALWDRERGELWLARDRVGKKPLYYGWAGDTLVFGSELKALWRHPQFDNGVDRDALALLLRYDYVPSPYCIHTDTFKLMPGALLRLDAAAVAAGAAAHDPARDQHRYWRADERMAAAIAQPFEGDIDGAEDRLDDLLREAVGLRMVADVPVGVFLSGGTDSSVVTSLMQALSAQPVRSFTIGFEGSHHDEAPLALQVARHLGTAHTELYVSGADALAVVPRLPAMFDEPFADASQVPTALVCKLARSLVTVALSGDGGDELFFGYTRYERALRNLRLLQRVPAPLRRWLARGAQGHGGVHDGADHQHVAVAEPRAEWAVDQLPQWDRDERPERVVGVGPREHRLIDVLLHGKAPADREDLDPGAGEEARADQWEQVRVDAQHQQRYGEAGHAEHARAQGEPERDPEHDDRHQEQADSLGRDGVPPALLADGGLRDDRAEGEPGAGVDRVEDAEGKHDDPQPGETGEDVPPLLELADHVGGGVAAPIATGDAHPGQAQ